MPIANILPYKKTYKANLLKNFVRSENKVVLKMLTELEIKNTKPRNVLYDSDEHGLYLRFDTFGYKYWILRYGENKKEHKKSLGPYPDLSLKDARLKCNEI